MNLFLVHDTQIQRSEFMESLAPQNMGATNNLLLLDATSRKFGKNRVDDSTEVRSRNKNQHQTPLEFIPT